MRPRHGLLLLLIAMISLIGRPQLCFAGEKPQKPGFSVAGIPVLKFDSDEGAAYGARLSFYYGAGSGYNPYHSLLDVQGQITTRGKKEAFLFYDSPYLIGQNQRLTAEIRYHENDQYPFYGFGSGDYQPAFADSQSLQFIDKDYYRYLQRRTSARANYQRQIGLIHLLAGASVSHTSIEVLSPETLLSREFADVNGSEGGFSNALRLALIYDTRDFEPAPAKGIWWEVMAEHFEPLLGSDYRFTRLSTTLRQYFSPVSRLVFAWRAAASRAFGDVPFYETAFMPGSFRIEEGIGGSKSVRGMLKNRAIGHTQLLVNLEWRLKLFGLSLLKQQFDYSLSMFVDSGGGWSRDEMLSIGSMQAGYGLGGHLAWNKNFIISVLVARGEEVDRALYIGVGYLF